MSVKKRIFLTVKKECMALTVSITRRDPPTAPNFPYTVTRREPTETSFKWRVFVRESAIFVVDVVKFTGIFFSQKSTLTVDIHMEHRASRISKLVL